jgi:hypothetical protein
MAAAARTGARTERYKGWSTRAGASILGGKQSLANLADRAMAGEVDPTVSGRQELPRRSDTGKPASPDRTFGDGSSSRRGQSRLSYHHASRTCRAPVRRDVDRYTRCSRVALRDADDVAAATFADIEEIAAQCRLPDCAHESEPNCAVRAALDDGSLERDRFDSWQKLSREVAFHARRTDVRARQEEHKKWAKLFREAKGRSRP